MSKFISKGLEALKRIKSRYNDRVCIDILEDFDIIEKELKQAEKDKEMLDIFKNAITIEREMPPELEIKENEKGSSYVFREAIKIHENRIEEMLKKSLRKWVLKNAFPKELKALEIIKNKEINVHALFLHLKRFDKPDGYNVLVGTKYQITQEEYDLLKEMLNK